MTRIQRMGTAAAMAWLLPLSMTAAHADTDIIVGVYDFPPVAQVDWSNKLRGLLRDLLTELEATHEHVDFHIFHTSPKRRYLDFDAHLYDVMFFESPAWGWEHKRALVSPPILKDEDLYIALRKPGRDSSFFDDIENRNIVAISGYHYGFAGLQTDPQALEERFNIEFSDSHSRNLRLIKADRPSVAEVAIINNAYLQLHLLNHPEDRDLFLISDRPDQEYLMSIIVHPNGPVTSRDMMKLLAPLIESGRYQALVNKWRMDLPLDLWSHLPHD